MVSEEKSTRRNDLKFLNESQAYSSLAVPHQRYSNNSLVCVSYGDLISEDVFVLCLCLIDIPVSYLLHAAPPGKQRPQLLILRTNLLISIDLALNLQ